jgi:regulation of enolase protein 1 (concanavalin A-like superfamily)
MRELVSAAALRAPLFTVLFVCVFSSATGAQTVPAPWISTDIGSPELSGSATYSSGEFHIGAGGADIWQASDEFHFVYQQVSGDVEIAARIGSLAVPHEWAKAGVMIRSSLNANAAHGFALASALHGVHFQRRPTDGAESLSTAATSDGAPVWVRAVRSGTRITTYWSANGTSWSAIGSDTVALGSSVYVGIAVTSHRVDTRTTASISNVSVTRSGLQGGLPAGLQSTDIGGPAITGSATYADGAYAIRAAGADIWDTADEFHFVYQPLTGNGEVIARVASMTYTDIWAKAGVMIRESLTGQSRHAMVVATAGAGCAFQRRADPGGYSDHTAGGSGTAPGWVRLVRTGSYFEAYRSSNGSAWTRIGADSIPMGETVYVGLAVTSHNAGAATDVVIDDFKVTAISSSRNQPPAVSITSPVSGSDFSVPASVAIAATAVDPENRMAAVEFYAGSTLIARETTSPYATTWLVSTAGTYTLTAVAYDADGNSTASDPVSVSVGASAAAAPRAVSFTASSDHTTNVTSYFFEVFTAGADPSTGTPIATSDLGKPAPSSDGTITVDRSTFFGNLAPGTYISTVSAIGPGGATRSSGVTFAR